MILFSHPEFAGLAGDLRRLLPLEEGRYHTHRFSNGQLELWLDTTVRDRVCAVLTTISPPDENLLGLLLLADTLYRGGAAGIHVLVPYLAYSRQDRDESGKSRAAGLLGPLFQAAHVTSLATIDIHSARAGALFTIPLAQLSSAALFAAAIRQNGLESATIVAPDHGAIERCEAVRALVPGAPPLLTFAKVREGEKVSSRLEGPVGRSAVIIDDILDSGATLLTACQQLQAAGAQEIAVMVTHGLFSGDRWQRLFECGVRTIYVTDSLPAPHAKGIEVLSSASILADHLRALG